MEVLCCMGLVRLVEEAVKQSGKEIPIRRVKIGVRARYYRLIELKSQDIVEIKDV